MAALARAASEPEEGNSVIGDRDEPDLAELAMQAGDVRDKLLVRWRRLKQLAPRQAASLGLPAYIEKLASVDANALLRWVEAGMKFDV